VSSPGEGIGSDSRGISVLFLQRCRGLAVPANDQHNGDEVAMAFAGFSRHPSAVIDEMKMLAAVHRRTLLDEWFRWEFLKGFRNFPSSIVSDSDNQIPMEHTESGFGRIPAPNDKRRGASKPSSKTALGRSILDHVFATFDDSIHDNRGRIKKTLGVPTEPRLGAYRHAPSRSTWTPYPPNLELTRSASSTSRRDTFVTDSVFRLMAIDAYYRWKHPVSIAGSATLFISRYSRKSNLEKSALAACLLAWPPISQKTSFFLGFAMKQCDVLGHGRTRWSHVKVGRCQKNILKNGWIDSQHKNSEKPLVWAFDAMVVIRSD
jgi:hypothetical protein